MLHNKNQKRIVAKIYSVLKIDVGYFSRGIFWLSASQLLVSIVAFITTITLANVLSKDQYGVYRYVLAAVAFLGSISLTGLGNATIQSVSRDITCSLKKIWQIGLKWNIFFQVSLLVLSIYYLVQDNNILAICFFIATLSAPLFSTNSISQSFLNGKKDFRNQSINSFLNSALPLLAVIATAAVTSNILIIIGSFFITQLVVSSATFWKTKNSYPSKEKKYDRNFEWYSVRLSLINLISIAAAHADKVLVFTLLGPTELAVYGIAFAFPEQIKSIFKNISQLILPKMAVRDYTKINFLSRKILLFLLLLAISTVLYIAIAPFVIHLFFPQYSEAVPYSRIYALSIISLVSIIPISQFFAHRKEMQLLTLNMTSSIIQLMLTLLLLLTWGLWGVVIARVISSYTVAITAYLINFKSLLSKDSEPSN